MEYKGKMVFDVEHEPTSGEIRVEIDFDANIQFGDHKISQIHHISEMQSFWIGYKERLDDASGDVVKAFLIQLCKKCISLAFQHNYGSNIVGLWDLFKMEEGYCTMNGSEGIKLIRLNGMDIDRQDEYLITVVNQIKEAWQEDGRDKH